MSQLGARRDLEAAAAFLGALWPAVRDMVLVGESMARWSRQSGVDQRTVPGYLRAALDRIVEFYAPRKEAARLVPIRAIAPGREEYSLEVEEVG
jgi:hypothetical protein